MKFTWVERVEKFDLNISFKLINVFSFFYHHLKNIYKSLYIAKSFCFATQRCLNV